MAVAPDGSVITSIGGSESAIWIHDENGERCLSSEGEVKRGTFTPSFNRDGTELYYLLRRPSFVSGPELWRINVRSGVSEAITPGVSVTSYDVSPDEKQVVYSTTRDGKSQLWLAPTNRSSSPKRIGDPDESAPYFGPGGQILFLRAEGKFNYLEKANPDGSGGSRVVPYPVGSLGGISPGRHWITAFALLPSRKTVNPVIISTEGEPARVVCNGYCEPRWSSNGDWLFVPVEFPGHNTAGRSLAIPAGPGEKLPQLPPDGIKRGAEASVVRGAQAVPRGDLVPGVDLSHFAYVKTTVHRNLYRITLR